MTLSQVKLNRKARVYMRARMANCVWCAALLLVSASSGLSQSADRLHTFFKQDIGLKDSEIADIDHGKAVAKILDSPTPSEVFVFGSVFIKAQPSAYVHIAVDLDRLKSLPNYLAIGRFSSPPQLSDLSGFELNADDVNDRKKCTPGNCEIQLPAENIDQFKTQIEWSGPDVAGQINSLAKKMVLEALVAYQKGGNVALGTYRDKKSPAQVSEQFRMLISGRPSWFHLSAGSFEARNCLFKYVSHFGNRRCAGIVEDEAHAKIFQTLSSTWRQRPFPRPRIPSFRASQYLEGFQKIISRSRDRATNSK